MTSLLLALVLAASPQTFLVALEPSSVYMSWQEPIVAGAVEEVRASHGRQAFTKHDARHTSARFLLSLNVAAMGSHALASVKIIELANGKLVSSNKVGIERATKELCVAEVRKLVKKLLEALPIDLPPPEPTKK
ncbi:MAG TPA: hypothetical protein VGK67_32050 [Myxococcales bacterium]|jgi:hypothetical protein